MQSQEEVKPKKSWRDAKIPQWVRDSVEAELVAGALSWPTEKKPEPVDFWWGGRDGLHGVARTGRFWTVHFSAYDVSTRLECHDIELYSPGAIGGSASAWGRDFMFRNVGLDGKPRAWGTNPPNGPLFATKRDAELYGLWLMCERFASRLSQQRAKLVACGDE